MRDRRFLVALAGLLGAGSVHAAPADTLRSELQPLQFLTGSCWSGTLPDGQSTDSHCFESVFGGRFLRDRHVVRGAQAPYEGETLYAWDPKQKKLVYTYWASDGGTSSGAAEASTDEITFHEAYVGDASQLDLKTVWTRRGDDGYEVRVTRKKDGAWQELWRISFHRDGAAAVDPPAVPKER